MNELILQELEEAFKKARNHKVLSNEQIARDIIKDWTKDLDSKYPEVAQAIRDLADTIE